MKEMTRDEFVNKLRERLAKHEQGVQDGHNGLRQPVLFERDSLSRIVKEPLWKPGKCLSGCGATVPKERTQRLFPDCIDCARENEQRLIGAVRRMRATQGVSEAMIRGARRGH